MQWSKVCIFTMSLFVAALGMNETLLYAARHQPSLVDDADLFCSVYTKIRDLDREDVILLGASRMQVGFDITTFHTRFPNRKILLLAQSGLGSSFPVFKDIVEKTNYRGFVVIDENEESLYTHNNDQLSSVKHCHNNFSTNRQLNRGISNWLQSHFLFLNPQSSSSRLWGNLAIEHKLPIPYYTKVLEDRQMITDYARAQPRELQALHDRRLKVVREEKFSIKAWLTPKTWFERTKYWQVTIEKFQNRGGKVIFVRIPVSQDRWMLESKMYPRDLYWQPLMNQLNVKSVHFADYPDLTNFQLPDTSHFDMRDKMNFTQMLLTHIQEQLPSLSLEKHLSH
jgi:hypothetical protein